MVLPHQGSVLFSLPFSPGPRLQHLLDLRSGFWGSRPKALSPALSLLCRHSTSTLSSGLTLAKHWPRLGSFHNHRCPGLTQPNEIEHLGVEHRYVCKTPRIFKFSLIGPPPCPPLCLPSAPSQVPLVLAFSLLSCSRFSPSHAHLPQSQGQLPREKFQTLHVTLAQRHSVAPHSLQVKDRLWHRPSLSSISWPH